MKFFGEKLVFLILLMTISACGRNEMFVNPTTSKQTYIPLEQVQGVWMSKETARVMRETGKLEYHCRMLKQYPNFRFAGVRLIEAYGGIYDYDPRLGKKEEMLEGIVYSSGDFKPTASFVDFVGTPASKYYASLLNGTLELRADLGKFLFAVEYTKSTYAEAEQYYAILETCETK